MPMPPPNHRDHSRFQLQQVFRVLLALQLLFSIKNPFSQGKSVSHHLQDHHQKALAWTVRLHQMAESEPFHPREKGTSAEHILCWNIRRQRESRLPNQVASTTELRFRGEALELELSLFCGSKVKLHTPNQAELSREILWAFVKRAPAANPPDRDRVLFPPQT